MANPKNQEADTLAVYALGRIEEWIANFARGAGVAEAELANRISALLSGSREGSQHRMPFLSSAPTNRSDLRLPAVEVAERPSSQLQPDPAGNEADGYARASNVVKSSISRGIIAKAVANGERLTTGLLNDRYPQIPAIAWQHVLADMCKKGHLRRIARGEYGAPVKTKHPAKAKPGPKPGPSRESVEIQNRILKAMEGREKMGLKEMGEVSNCREHNLYHHLKLLVEDGRLVKLDRGEYGPGKKPAKTKRRGRPVQSKIKVQILAAMKGREKMNLDELVAVSDAKHQHSLYEPLRQLIAEGQFEKIGSGLSGVYGPGKKFSAPE